MSAREFTAKHVDNELWELKKLANALGPDDAWAQLRKAVIRLDNHKRALARRNPTTDAPAGPRRWLASDQPRNIGTP
jgi:hypothetical protein